MRVVRIVLVIVAGFWFAGYVFAAPKTAEEEAVFIENGLPRLVYVDGSSWKFGDGFVENSEGRTDLYADRCIGSGDFHIRATLRLMKLNWTAAAFKLGKSNFGFDGKDRRIYLSGLMFGGREKVTSLGASNEFVEDKAWFKLDIIRKGSEISFLIDDKPVHKVEFNSNPIGKIAFYPCRATMQIRDFSARGKLIKFSTKPRSYTIPTIDLANEVQRQVIVDKEKGQYLGHPTTVLLEDNKTMVIVYPKGHGRGAIVMKKSTDGGLTWSDRLPTPENWATSKEVPTIYPVVDSQGKRRLIMFSGIRPIRMAFSEDNGKTWTPLTPIKNLERATGIVAMADLAHLKDGSYMAFFHDFQYRVYKTISSDGGLSWSKPEMIIHHSDAGLCEPGLVRSPNGKQLAMLLRENKRIFNSFVAFSGDEGKTWSEPIELPAALSGDRHQCLYAPDGRLVVAFRDTTHVSPTKGDFVAWVGTYDDIVRGREGQYRIRLLDNKAGADCGYPALELLPDGTFVATTYGHWTKGEKPFIVSVRFKLEEIDAKAALQP